MVAEIEEFAGELKGSGQRPAQTPFKQPALVVRNGHLAWIDAIAMKCARQDNTRKARVIPNI
jgi:hypothetical protein